jgi:hypothetical protein
MVAHQTICLWITSGQLPNQRSKIFAMGWRDTPMDIIERFFFVTGMTCLLVLIGLAFLPL